MGRNGVRQLVRAKQRGLGTPRPIAGPGTHRSSQNDSRPFGVVDIGSNSVRLVVFDELRRDPTVLFNEKVMCALGRSLGVTGRLDEEGVTRAIGALRRFRAIADGMGVQGLHVVATAAAREAENGAEFVAEARQEIGAPIDVLSGLQEAEYAALGVLSGTPEADGFAGDLGGGSLELVRLSAGKWYDPVTLPLGPLRLIAKYGTPIEPGRLDEIYQDVLQVVGQVPWLSQMGGRHFYGVGGAWRSFAKLNMALEDYPLRILHQYTMPAEEAGTFAGFLAQQSRKSLDRMADISRRRVETMPYASLVMKAVLEASRSKSVIISAHGLREGILFSHLPAAVKAKDPLLCAAEEEARRSSRSTGFLQEIEPWWAPLWETDAAANKRLRQVAALLSNSQRRGHPDYRAENAYNFVLRAPFAAISHSERVRLAAALYYRYGGRGEPPLYDFAARKLQDVDLAWSRRVGLALRLAYVLSAGVAGQLPNIPLRLEEDAIVLSLPKDLEALFGERVQKHFNGLAGLWHRQTRIEELS